MMPTKENESGSSEPATMSLSLGRHQDQRGVGWGGVKLFGPMSSLISVDRVG